MHLQPPDDLETHKLKEACSCPKLAQWQCHMGPQAGMVLLPRKMQQCVNLKST